MTTARASSPDSLFQVMVGGFTVLISIICTALLVFKFFHAEETSYGNINLLWTSTMKPFFWESFVLLKSNQFCQALAFSSLTYYAVYVTGFIYRSLILSLISGMSSSLVLHNTDPNFNTVIDFLAEHILPDIPGSFSSIQATTKKKDWTRKDWIHEYLGTNGRDIPTFDYRPDNDNIIHKFMYKGHQIYLSR